MAHRTLLARRLENRAYNVYRFREPDTDPDAPVATALSHPAIFGHVDFRSHEAVVVENGTRRTYLPIPLDVPTADRRVPAGGVCIALRPEAGLSEAYLRGWIHAMKGALGNGIERGLVSEREARAYLEARLRAFEVTTDVIVP